MSLTTNTKAIKILESDAKQQIFQRQSKSNCISRLGTILHPYNHPAF